ncbi:hypothetical protein AB205_0163490 [Aquarana catesbeiana]|uniref:Uncharacterized protein n=1 Tax=Aquarana catesbeiana TaxID=8400 RepID=A0A2G9RSD1_AQUCT|nr:hypothetical protein AB205_0163490 [Aquarana catesbeiana]
MAHTFRHLPTRVLCALTYNVCADSTSIEFGIMAGSVRRPEQTGPPELFYNEDQARKYTQNSRIIEIQSQMSERAVELLCLREDQPCYLLDVGCGSGLSGDYITEQGHHWVGIDISTAMLDVALDREIEGDLILGDMGQGIPFRPGTFDGCIRLFYSSAFQLCNGFVTPTRKPTIPHAVFSAFSQHFILPWLVAPVQFCSYILKMLSRCRLLHLKPSHKSARGADIMGSLDRRAVAHTTAGTQRRLLYVANATTLELVTAQAMRAGFTGGMVVDFPNSTKAKKFFLCLFAGVSGVLPKGLGEESAEQGVTHQASFVKERMRFKNAKGKSVKKSKDWILEKKERRRRQGKEVRADTKYSGRKRRPNF